MKRLIKGTAGALFAKSLGVGCNFLFHLFIAGLLGAQGAGYFFLAFMMIVMASTLSRFGLGNTIVRFTAAGMADKNWGAIRGMYRKTMVLVLSIASLTTLILSLTAPLWAHYVFRDDALATPLRWMSLAIVPHAVFMIHTQLLLGAKRIVLAQLIQGLSVPLIAILAAFALAPRFHVMGVATAYIAASVVAASLGIYVWRRLATPMKDAKPAFAYHDLLNSCRPLLAAELMQMLIVWLPTFALGIFCPVEEVGLYQAAFRVALLISLVMMAVESFVAPRFSEMHKRGDHVKLARLAQHATLLTISLAGVGLILICIAPVSIMGLFGKEFILAAPALIILAAGQFANAASGPSGHLLMMSGREHLYRDIMVAAAVIQIFACFLLIPAYGLIGAASAAALTVAFKNLASVYCVRRMMNISMIPVFYAKARTA